MTKCFGNVRPSRPFDTYTASGRVLTEEQDTEVREDRTRGLTVPSRTERVEGPRTKEITRR